MTPTVGVKFPYMPINYWLRKSSLKKWSDFTIISQKVSLGEPLQKLLIFVENNGHHRQASLHYFLNLLVVFQNHFVGLLHRWPSTKPSPLIKSWSTHNLLNVWNMKTIQNKTKILISNTYPHGPFCFILVNPYPHTTNLQ